MSPAFLQQCVAIVGRHGLFGLLRQLNATTPYRFTGIYRFDGRWVRSVRLFDREHPETEFGSDVLWDESYCRIASEDGEACEIVDSLLDARVATHVARQSVQCYVAVLLRKPDGSHYGTLCHYDVVPRRRTAGAADDLRLVRPIVEQALTTPPPLAQIT